MTQIEARAMEHIYDHTSVAEVPLGGLRITGAKVRPPNVSKEEWQQTKNDMHIPDGTALHVPLENSHMFIFQDREIDDGTLTALLTGASGVLFQSEDGLEIGHEDGETLTSVDSPALTYLLDTYARLHQRTLAFISEPGAISVEGVRWRSDTLTVDNIRFLDN